MVPATSEQINHIVLLFYLSYKHPLDPGEAMAKAEGDNEGGGGGSGSGGGGGDWRW